MIGCARREGRGIVKFSVTKVAGCQAEVQLETEKLNVEVMQHMGQITEKSDKKNESMNHLDAANKTLVIK